MTTTGNDLKIAIIIITYNRPDDMYELVQNLASLDQVGELAEEIVIVNNNSSVPYEKAEKFIDAHPHLPWRYMAITENLGVSRGRNYAIRQSKAPLLVFIDDDAIFQNKDALLQIKNIFTDPAIGLLSFRVFYYETLTLQQSAFPHKQFQKRKELHRFATAYFAGCGHAIRRSVFDKVGYYPENFFYGMEEYDLSYRAIQAGFGIVYDDRVSILHKESPLGRLPSKEKLRGMWVNKSRVAWKYLPFRYFLTTALLWSFQYLRKTGYHIGGWFKGWSEVFSIRSTEKRSPVGREGMAYLEKVEARLWY
jgi:GT2 family glycosyltransferase